MYDPVAARSGAGAPTPKPASAARKAPERSAPKTTTTTRTATSSRVSNGGSSGARGPTGAGDAQLRIQNEELNGQLTSLKESLESLEKVRFSTNFDIADFSVI